MSFSLINVHALINVHTDPRFAQTMCTSCARHVHVPVHVGVHVGVHAPVHVNRMVGIEWGKTEMEETESREHMRSVGFASDRWCRSL